MQKSWNSYESREVVLFLQLQGMFRAKEELLLDVLRAIRLGAVAFESLRVSLNSVCTAVAMVIY